MAPKQTKRNAGTNITGQDQLSSADTDNPASAYAKNVLKIITKTETPKSKDPCRTYSHLDPILKTPRVCVPNSKHILWAMKGFKYMFGVGETTAVTGFDLQLPEH